MVPKKTGPHALVLALVLAITPSCARAPSEDSTAPLVRNLGGGSWRHAELVQEASIGAPEGAIEYEFGLVRAHALVDDRIVVRDWQVGHPRVYDLDGNYLHDIGSGGDGPQQFRRPFGMAVSPDGRLFVRDPGKGRVFEVTVDGQFLGDRVVTGGLLTPVEGGLIWMRSLLREESAPGKLLFAYRAFDEEGTTDAMIRAPTFETEPAWLTSEWQPARARRRLRRNHPAA